MDNTFEIRLIKMTDTRDTLEIYKPYVQNTIVSFEYDVPTMEDFTDRIKTATEEFPWLVCLQDEKIIGYAYAHKHRFRSAYQWSPESTIYLKEGFHGRGLGKILYETLFSILKGQGYFNVFAGVGLPNEKSVNFHRASGFTDIGVFKKIGYKHGNWHDTHWFQLTLSGHITDPPQPKTIREIKESRELEAIIYNANQRLKKIKTQ